MSKPFTIYRSSAGSGKTRTLAREYLKLALRLRSNYFRHILAVTFTNKATQEMKDRILAYLNDFANGRLGGLGEELMAELNLDPLTFQQYAQETQAAILHTYSSFSISTIDAFFQKVIRAFTREAGLTGDYKLELDPDPVLEEVIDSLIDELGSNRELTDWVVEFARENLENERPWDIRNNLLEFSREIFRDEFRNVESEIEKQTRNRSYFRNLRKDLSEVRNRFLSSVCGPAREAVAILERQEWDSSDLYHGKNAGVITYLRMAATVKKVRDIKDASPRVRSFAADHSIWPSQRTTYAPVILAVAEKELVPRLAGIIETCENGIEAALSAELVLENLYVFGLVADISRKLREYKDENNLMLLADAPRFLQGVIQDSDTPFIYEKVGSFYRNYLIDEFQDTSGMQWGNFLPLLVNSLDQGYPSLVVGDVKQAVYRWRGGDLELLQQKVEKQIGSERVDLHNLSKNFRSSARLVSFNNAVFKRASAWVAAATGEAVAQEAYNDVSQEVSRDIEGFVRVSFFEDEKDGLKWREKAMEQIPLILEQLQEQGASPADIAILVRKNEEGQDVIRHLLAYTASGKGKPGCRYDVISGESLRIDSALTVSLLEGALMYLSNPDDDIARALLAVEFARLYDPVRPLTEVFAVTNQAVFESYLPAAFTKEKAVLKKLPLFEMTENLIRIFRLGEVKGELPYLQAFQNLVLEFQTRERNDLGAFLKWWEDNKKKKSVPVSGSVDAAQIITIHKSKGLQFRFVIIPFCSWNIDHDNFQAPQLWVKADTPPFAAAGYLPVKYSPTLEKSYFGSFYKREKSRTYLDNLNLLYVALTRAEEGMIVMAGGPGTRAANNSVGTVLYEALSQAEELASDFDSVGQVFQAGQWPPVELLPGSRTHSRENGISIDSYTVSPWRDKLVIRQNGRDYFAPAPVQDKITYGIQVHQLLSAVITIDDIPGMLEKMVSEGAISVDEKALLSQQLQVLFQDERIRGWFSSAWEVRTEVPVLLPGGEERRIDRLLTSGKRAVIIDFKTGLPSKADQQQVAAYVGVLRQMNFVDVEAYLLYLSTGEVLAVSEVKTKVVKKQDKTQLDLGI